MTFITRQQAVWTFTALALVGLVVAWWLKLDPVSGAKATPDASWGSTAGSTPLGASDKLGPQDSRTFTSSSPWSAASPASEPPRTGQVPATLELPLLQASLSALQTNGANLSALMRSRHVVQVTDRRTADELTRWGRQQGFAMSSDQFYLHGGIEAQMLYFDRHIVPDAQRIQLDGLSILQALTGMDTAEYGTWMGEINRP